MQELGPKVDRGDKAAEGEYLALVNRQLAISDARTARRRSEPSPVATPTTSVPSTPTVSNERRQAENDLAALRGQLQSVNAAYAASRTPEAATERELVVRRLKDAERALPFAGKTDDDLTAAIEDIEASVEELREARDALPKGSVRYRRAEREWANTLARKDAIGAELRARSDGRAIAEVAAQQVRRRAIEGIKLGREAEVQQLKGLLNDRTLSREERMRLQLDVRFAEERTKLPMRGIRLEIPE
jgi:hypothetical protein